MADLISLTIDGQMITVHAGATVIAAIAVAALNAQASSSASSPGLPGTPGVPASSSTPGTLGTLGGHAITRRSVSGMLRGPVCGMGICQECRVTIDGRPHQLACQTPCSPGMQVKTAVVEIAA